MTSTGRLPAIALATLLLSGCGLPFVGTGTSGTASPTTAGPATTATTGGTAPSATTTGTTTAPSATTAGTGTAPSATATAGTVNPDDPTGAAARLGVTLVDPVGAGMVAYGIVTFQSPSGRIRCAMADATADPTPSAAAGPAAGQTRSYARCDISGPTFTPPRKPPTCEFDWGGAMTVTPGTPGRFACVSDAVDGGKALAYGSAVINGDLICISRQAGVTCQTVTTALHGFRIAKESYTVF